MNYTGLFIYNTNLQRQRLQPEELVRLQFIAVLYQHTKCNYLLLYR